MAQDPGMKWFIGGVIHEDAAGRILSALARAGVERLEVAPFLPESVVQVPKRKAPLALPPPKKSNQQEEPSLKSGSIGEKIYQAIAAAKGTTVEIQALLAIGTAAGAHRKVVHGALYRMQKQGLIVRSGRGHYGLAASAPKKGEKPAAKKPPASLKIKSASQTNVQLVIEFARKHSPKPVTYTMLKAHLEAHGRRGLSAGTILNYLAKSGGLKEAKNTSPREYTYIPT